MHMRQDYMYYVKSCGTSVKLRGALLKAAVTAGILGAHAVLFATSLCIVLMDLIEGKSIFKDWYTYMVRSFMPAQRTMIQNSLPAVLCPYLLTALGSSDFICYLDILSLQDGVCMAICRSSLERLG